MYDGKALHRLFLVAAVGIAVVCALSLWADVVPAAAQLLYLLDVTSSEQTQAIYGAIPPPAVPALAYVVAGVPFLLWLGRARRHLIDFEARPAYSPGWAVGAWIIPIASFILPALVVADVARWSATDEATRPSRRDLLRLVWAWWAGYGLHSVGILVIAVLQSRITGDPTTPPIVLDVARLVLLALYVASGVLAMLMMRAIGQAQAAQAAGVVSQPDPADFPAFTVDEVQHPA